MNAPLLFSKHEQRDFFAHHMLLHAAELELEEAKVSEVGRFNRCLAAMTMTSLAVEALLNAVGSRVDTEWETFERLRAAEKLDFLVDHLGVARAVNTEPWSTLRFLAGFRNDIAHAKPDAVVKTRVLPEAAIPHLAFDTPMSKLECQITTGNASRALDAVKTLKAFLTDALPAESRYGIFADMWTSSVAVHQST